MEKDRSNQSLHGSGFSLLPVGHTFLFFFLLSPVNVFKGMFNNAIFVTIMVATAGLQVVIVQFGGQPLHVVSGGLSLEYWGLSLLLGVGSLPIQQIINILYSFGLRSTKKWRSNRRRERAGAMTVQQTGGNANTD
jgi:Cation transporting ATPase, C-terminus